MHTPVFLSFSWEVGCINNRFTCLLSCMEISNLSLTFWEGTALLPVTEPAEPVMNLKLALHSNAWGLEDPTSYTPQSCCFIASKIQDFRFLFHYCPYALASIILCIHFSLAQSTSSCQLTWYACRYEFQREKDHHSDKKNTCFTVLRILGIETCCKAAFNNSAVCAF